MSRTVCTHVGGPAEITISNETCPALSGVQDVADPLLFSARLGFVAVKCGPVGASPAASLLLGDARSPRHRGSEVCASRRLPCQVLKPVQAFNSSARDCLPAAPPCSRTPGSLSSQPRLAGASSVARSPGISRVQAALPRLGGLSQHPCGTGCSDVQGRP